MNILTKALCKTTGAIGMGVALYDSAKIGNQYSKSEAQWQQQKYLERAYYDSRTIDSRSYASNSLRKGTFDLQTKSPIPQFYGKIKGFIKGTLTTLGNYLPTVICSALAIAAKGNIAKAGAIGVILTFCYDILRNGLGLGKQTPMD